MGVFGPIRLCQCPNCGVVATWRAVFCKGNGLELHQYLCDDHAERADDYWRPERETVAILEGAGIEVPDHEKPPRMEEL